MSIKEKLVGMARSSKDEPKSRSSCAVMIGRSVIRFLQFVLGVVVAGVYGVRINAERAAGTAATPLWTYAIVVGGASALTTIIYSLPLIKSQALFAWDLLLFILWTAVFGAFATIYLHRYGQADAYQGTDTGRMRATMWIDLVNMVLWFITGTYGAAKFIRTRKATKSIPASEVV